MSGKLSVPFLRANEQRVLVAFVVAEKNMMCCKLQVASSRIYLATRQQMNPRFM